MTIGTLSPPFRQQRWHATFSLVVTGRWTAPSPWPRPWLTCSTMPLFLLVLVCHHIISFTLWSFMQYTYANSKTPCTYRGCHLSPCYLHWPCPSILEEGDWCCCSKLVCQGQRCLHWWNQASRERGREMAGKTRHTKSVMEQISVHGESC